jgi:WD40 repeat protein
VWALRAESQTKEKLFESRLAEARAFSLSHRSGQRFRSLALLDEAAGLAGELRLPPERFHDLRNATIGALAMADLCPERTWDGFPEGSARVTFGDRLEVYARTDLQGNCSIRRVADDAQMFFLPAPAPTAVRDHELPAFLSPDARFVAVRQADRRLQLWKLDGLRADVSLDLPAVWWVDFHTDGRTAAFSHVDGTISVRDLATGRELHHLRPDALTREAMVAVHPTLPLVAVASYHANVVQVRDLRTGQVLKSLPAPAGGHWVAWHPAGHTLAVGDGDGSLIRLFDRATFEPRGQIRTGNFGLRFSFNHTGDRLAIIGWSPGVELFDSASGRRLFWASITPTYFLRFSADDRRLGGFVQQDKIGTLEVGDGRERRPLASQVGHEGEHLAHPVVHSDGRLVAALTSGGIGLWDLEGGTLLAVLPMAERRFVDFEPGPEGALVTGDDSGTYRWPIRSAGSAGTLRVGPPQPLALPAGHVGSMSQDGSALVSAFRPVGPFAAWGGAWVWRRDSPERPLHLAVGEYTRSVAASPDGRWVVTGHDDDNQRVLLWDARNGRLERTLLNQSAGGFFSPDGRWLILNKGIGAWSNDKSWLFRTDTWEVVRELPNAALFAPDSWLLLMATGSSNLRLVEVTTGRELAVLENPGLGPPGTARFSPDGTYLLTADALAGGIHVWDLPRLRAELARRNLEWDAPPYQARPAPSGRIQVEVDWGDYARLREQEKVKNFDRAVEAAPHLAVRWNRRGLFHWRAGRHQQALADLGKAVALMPHKATFCHDLARFLVIGPERWRDAPWALRLAEQVVQEVPGEWWYHNTLGVALYRVGRTDEAVTALERSLRKGDGEYDGLNLYFLALCQHRLGRAEKARDCFQKAVAWRKAKGQLTTDWAPDLDVIADEARTVLPK